MAEIAKLQAEILKNQATIQDLLARLNRLEQAATSNPVQQPQKQEPEKKKEPEKKAQLTKPQEAPKNASKEEEDEPTNEGKKKKEKGANKKALGLKTPKGTRDYDPIQMRIREEVFGIIKTIFRRHGGVQIETPIFELKEILTGKYGEDSKLIFDLQDQGGELCSLRYDLTVPFARYVAMNKVKQIKRYQIGRVYRRDNPIMTKGRFREFYQCDFDIAGEYDLMVPDAEAVKLMTEILTTLNVGAYKIKINNRKLLDGIFAIAGVPEEDFRPISSAVDKLDKEPWEAVRKEMVETKNLKPEVADKIGEFVVLKGKPKELLNEIRTKGICNSNKSALTALNEMEILFNYVEAYECLDKLEFDLSLARGLDYYTGVIYEAVLVDEKEVGSIAAGGRYDNLVGMFGGTVVPAVGFSVGVERIFSILEKRAQQTNQLFASETHVLVVSVEKDLIVERMKICNELWRAGINAELVPRLNPKVQAQLTYANNNGIPFAIIFGKNELESKQLQLKHLAEDVPVEAKQEAFPRDKLVEFVQSRLAAYKQAKAKLINSK